MYSKTVSLLEEDVRRFPPVAVGFANPLHLTVTTLPFVRPVLGFTMIAGVTPHALPAPKARPTAIAAACRSWLSTAGPTR
jgi:hypothetical protein